MIPEDRQFNIWEPEHDPRLMMRCTICGKEQQIASAPLHIGEIDPVAIFMQQHEDCFYNQQPEQQEAAEG